MKNLSFQERFRNDLLLFISSGKVWIKKKEALKHIIVSSNFNTLEVPGSNPGMEFFFFLTLEVPGSNHIEARFFFVLGMGEGFAPYVHLL